MAGDAYSYYRVTLPVVGPSGIAAKEGTWKAVLEFDDKFFKRWLGSLDNFSHLLTQARTHGVRFNVSVYALSNLRLRGTLTQNSFEPGAKLNLRCVLTEYGLPLAGDASVTANLTRPDGTTALLPLAEVETGVFEVDTTATLSGIYTAYAIAAGKTARKRAFTRERIFTAAVWKGGDDRNPTTPDDPDEQTRCLCELLRCLLGPTVLTDRFEKRMAKEGINPDNARKCIDSWCRCKLQPEKQGETARQRNSRHMADLAKMLDAHDMAEAVGLILSKLSGKCK